MTRAVSFLTATGYKDGDKCKPYPESLKNSDALGEMDMDKICYRDGKLQAVNPIAILGGVNKDTNTYVFKTNEKGLFNFKLQYPKVYSNWVKVEIIASTVVDGSETTLKQEFIPAYSTEDIDRVVGIVPNDISPYNNAKE